MKTIHTFFYLGALLILCWQCAGPEPKARSWQSFIPEGYALRDSVRGDLNIDSIPDFLLVLDSSAALSEAPKRLLMLLYGSAPGKFEMAGSTDKLLYDQRSGNVAPIEPYEKAAIGAGFFAVWQRGGQSKQLWTYKTRFGLDTISGEWYLDRTVLNTRNGEDTLPLVVTEKQLVRDTHDFGKVLLQDFDITILKESLKDTSTRDDRFITYNFFKTNKLTLPAIGDDLDSIAALCALFPGRFIRDLEYQENKNLVFWVCKTCPEKTLKAYDYFTDELPDEIQFPYPDGNFTNVIKVLTWKENRKTHKAIFFSTATDSEVTGHFSKGVLGMAVFQQNESLWQLISFSPSVTLEGSYSTAVAPDRVIRVGKQAFFELEGGNPNFNGSRYIFRSRYIFGLLNNVPEVVFHEQDSNCEFNGVNNNPIQWKTESKFMESKTRLPELMLITTGHFQKEKEEQSGWQRIPWFKKLLRQHPGQDSFDFKVERRFRFNGKKYVPAL